MAAYAANYVSSVFGGKKDLERDADQQKDEELSMLISKLERSIHAITGKDTGKDLERKKELWPVVLASGYAMAGLYLTGAYAALMSGATKAAQTVTWYHPFLGPMTD